MKEHRVGIIMNGVTGRMGTNQHLVRSILAIRNQGGIQINPKEVIIPDPILLGRNEAKLEKLAGEHGLSRYSTDLDACLSDPDFSVYFDAQRTDLRVPAVLKAIAAGKAVYCEKPPATNLEDAVKLVKAAQDAGVKNGIVQDKLWLPGFQKLRLLLDSGFFGKLVAVRGEFGYWVFDGKHETCQRPSWNYRKEDGGGIIMDMFCHWSYVVENLFSRVSSVSCMGATHIEERVDEEGKPYPCTAEDAAYATFLCDSGLICRFNSSWVVRVRRDDLLTIQVDGTGGSAVAGLRECWIQPAASTPRPVWNPDETNKIDFYGGWQRMPDNRTYDNAFKVQWELFLKHIVLDTPFRYNLMEGAKGVQLAEKGLESWNRRAWVDIEPLA
jgi:predicted dehydrogenase